MHNHGQLLAAAIKSARCKVSVATICLRQIKRLWRRLISEPLIYDIDSGTVSSMSADVRGGKGLGLAQLKALGLPVPPAVTVGTKVSRYYAENGALPRSFADELLRAIHSLEEKSASRFGCTQNPLLVSVRSGAPVSMPGMMDTILNVGLNRQVVSALAVRAGEKVAWDTYRRFLLMFGSTVFALDRAVFENRLAEARRAANVESDAELSVEQLQAVCRSFEEILHQRGCSIPEDPLAQLALAVVAVLDSWQSPRAIAYRQNQGIADDLGTAVNIQMMVFGNTGARSGTGVVFSANPLTGEEGLYGEYLANAQGEDVVAGVRTPQPISSLALLMPAVYQQLVQHVATLARHYRDMVDVEFTVENGTLCLLQVRSAKRSQPATLAFAVNQVESGDWLIEDAIASVGEIDQFKVGETSFETEALTLALAAGALTGQAASPGVATGRLFFTVEAATAAAGRGEDVIMARIDTSPDDLPGMLCSRGVATACGGATSHAAVVARGLHVPAIVGCNFTIEAGQLRSADGSFCLAEGDYVSLDGTKGLILAGVLPIVSSAESEAVEKLRGYYRQTSLCLDTPVGIDAQFANTAWSMNQFLNDFYLLNSMLTVLARQSGSTADPQLGKALDRDLHKELSAELSKVESQLAGIMACYLSIAVYSELYHLPSSVKRNDAAARELIRLGELDQIEQVRSTKILAEIGRYDHLSSTRELAARSFDYQENFFIIAAEAFLSQGWIRSFGGRAWSQIAIVLREYLAGRMPRAVFIDHVFDLEHNNGSVFDKHFMVSSQTNNQLLRLQLNIKREATEVTTLFANLTSVCPLVSPNVQIFFDRGVAAGQWQSIN